MSVDDIARRAGADLRTAFEGEHGHQVEAGLAAVHSGHRRRQRRRGAATVLAAAILVGGFAVLGPLAGPHSPAPAGPVTGSPSPSSDGQDCASDGFVVCVGPRQVRVTTSGTSYHVRMPAVFDAQPVTGRFSRAVDLLQHDGRAGVTLLPDVRAAGSTSATAGARALAHWISTRPFLEASDVMSVRLGGQPAWRVDARLRHDVPAGAAAGCNGAQRECWPVLDMGRRTWQTGVWTGMVCSYYVFDGPGGRVSAVWPWAFDHSAEALNGNEELLRDLLIAPAGG